MHKSPDIGDKFLDFLRNLSSQVFLFSMSLFVLKSTMEDDKFVNNKWLGWFFFGILFLLATASALVNFCKFGFFIESYYVGARCWIKVLIWLVFIICAVFLLVASVVAALKFAEIK